MDNYMIYQICKLSVDGVPVKDIAKIVGVSVSSVYRVLNKKGSFDYTKEVPDSELALCKRELMMARKKIYELEKRLYEYESNKG